jgi:uracil-DNA glycosylase family 4
MSDAPRPPDPGEPALRELAAEIASCRRCPRLVAWREEAAANPPRRFRGEPYWARPIPGFGDPAAAIFLVGLAPAAHGANRTARMFTGDRSGDWLYAALHRAGLANQPTSVSADDGLRLAGVWIGAAVRCAPPANKPTPDERDTCRPFLERELDLIEARVLVCLGAVGWDAALRVLAARGEQLPRPKPRFGHGAEARVGAYTLLGCFHPSQQNTFTGKLTEPMTDALLERAKQLAALG